MMFDMKRYISPELSYSEIELSSDILQASSVISTGIENSNAWTNGTGSGSTEQEIEW